MIKLFKYKYFNVLLHVLAWSIVLFFPYLVSSSKDQYRIGPLPGAYFTLSGMVHILVFYVNALFLYPKFLNRTYWPIYAISVVVLIFLSYWVKFRMLAGLFPDFLPDGRAHVLFPSVMVFIASIFYSVMADKMKAEQLQKENKARQLEMELELLRSRISPHFLFNILTSLVFLSRKKSDHLEASLLRLSGLMRYMLYGSGEKMPLSQEVECVENYIALQKLRFGSEVKTEFKIMLSPNETDSIEPMLLIPFVENAFKHGTGYIDQPTINISLTHKQNLLIFEVKNKFDREAGTNKQESSGIGLSNVRSRLELLYPGRHDLLIQRDQNLFSINLTLQLL
jgi:two-component system LytT family sensor kinase